MLTDPSLILPHLWVLIVLVPLGGLSAVDNAIVIAVMVKHSPPEQRKKVLFYGLLGVFVFRFLALLLVSITASLWFIQAAGAAYLTYMSVKSLWQLFEHPEIESPEAGDDHHYDGSGEEIKASNESSWGTVLEIESAGITSVIDSILAALAAAVALPKVGIHFGGMDLGQLIVMFLSGMIGVILIYYAATWFIELLNKYPRPKGAVFVVVGWVGIKLVVMVLAYPNIAVLPEHFPHGALWQPIFWTILTGLVTVGWLGSAVKNKKLHK